MIFLIKKLIIIVKCQKKQDSISNTYDKSNNKNLSIIANSKKLSKFKRLSISKLAKFLDIVTIKTFKRNFLIFKAKKSLFTYKKALSKL